MRLLVGVLLVGLPLALLAGVALRGVRRVAWPGQVDEAGRTTVQTVVEGLIVLAAIIVGVVVVVALASY
jgi:L-lactate permease